MFFFAIHVLLQVPAVWASKAHVSIKFGLDQASAFKVFFFSDSELYPSSFSIPSNALQQAERVHEPGFNTKSVRSPSNLLKLILNKNCFRYKYINFKQFHCLRTLKDRKIKCRSKIAYCSMIINTGSIDRFRTPIKNSFGWKFVGNSLEIFDFLFCLLFCCSDFVKKIVFFPRIQLKIMSEIEIENRDFWMYWAYP